MTYIAVPIENAIIQPSFLVLIDTTHKKNDYENCDLPMGRLKERPWLLLKAPVTFRASVD